MNDDRSVTKEEVLAQILGKSVTMRSRAYFVLTALSVLAVATLVVLLSIFLASLAVFAIAVNGHDTLLTFGWRGLVAFIAVAPWPLIAADLALICLLQWLLSRFRFGYRRPVLFLLIGLLVVLGSLGTFFEFGTHFHDERFLEAERGELPEPFGEWYEGAYAKPPEIAGVYRGVVLEVEEESFLLDSNDHDADEDDGVWEVLLPSWFEERLEKGDRVYVAGDREGNTVEPYGIRVLR